jgi:hypothetical protein
MAMRLKNLSTQTVDLPVKGEARDGVPPTESLAPDETRDVPVRDENSGTLRGLLIAGILANEGAQNAQKKPKE